MATTRDPRKNHRYRNRIAREKRRLERDPSAAVCWLCGEAIDMALPYTHRNAFTLDHITPIARGGDVHAEALPAHRSCNSSRGNVRDSNTTTLLDW